MCEESYLTEKENFETFANHSSNNFCKLKIRNNSESDFITPEDLLTLIIIKSYCFDNLVNEENMKIIKKFENLGIIKFETKWYEEGRRRIRRLLFK